MILLHHPEVALSRELLAALPPGVAVVDWTEEQAVAAYAGPAPSALPSVVLEIPAYAVEVPQLDEGGTFLGMGLRTVPAHLEALRLPATWQAVEAYGAFVAQRAARQPGE